MPAVRVVVVHSSAELYGADRMLVALVKALARTKQYHVIVMIPDDLPDYNEVFLRDLWDIGAVVKFAAVPVMRRADKTPAGILRLLRRANRFRAQLVSASPSIVVCGNSSTLLAAPISRLVGISKVVLHLQEIWTGNDRLVLGFFSVACSRVMAISMAAANSIPGFLRRKVSVVPNAVHDSISELRYIGSSIHPINFLVASRWNAWKGHKTLLEAWASLPAPPGLLTVLGGPPPLGQATDVVDMIRELDLESSVHVAGEVSNIEPYLDQCDVLILPSDHPEPFGLVLIEAFKRARPVISSSQGGPAEIVEHDINGWTFENMDVFGLASLLAKMDKKSVAVAGVRARETYERLYKPFVFEQNVLKIFGDT